MNIIANNFYHVFTVLMVILIIGGILDHCSGIFDIFSSKKAEKEEQEDKWYHDYFWIKCLLAIPAFIMICVGVILAGLGYIE